MIRTKLPKRIRTKFKKPKIQFIRKNCPPRSKTWTDNKGKVHKGLLIRQIRKSKAKGFSKLIYISPESNDKTIIILKSNTQKRV